MKLYIWDAAVPALPLIAQLLLAAVPGHRRIPPVPAAVTVRRSVATSLVPPLPATPRGEGALYHASVHGRRGVAHDVQDSQLLR